MFPFFFQNLSIVGSEKEIIAQNLFICLIGKYFGQHDLADRCWLCKMFSIRYHCCWSTSTCCNKLKIFLIFYNWRKNKWLINWFDLFELKVIVPLTKKSFIYTLVWNNFLSIWKRFRLYGISTWYELCWCGSLIHIEQLP